MQLRHYFSSLLSFLNGGHSASNRAESTNAEPTKAGFTVHVTPGGRVYVDPEEYLKTDKVKKIIEGVNEVFKKP